MRKWAGFFKLKNLSTWLRTFEYGGCSWFLIIEDCMNTERVKRNISIPKMVLQELKEQAQHCLYQRFQNTAAALTQVKLETSLDTKVIELKKKNRLLWELEACAQFCNNNVNNFSSRFTKGKLRRGVIGSLSRWGNQVYVFHLSIFWHCCNFSQFFDVCPLNVGYTGGQWFTEWDPDIVKQKYGLAFISKMSLFPLRRLLEVSPCFTRTALRSWGRQRRLIGSWLVDYGGDSKSLELHNLHNP